MFALQIREESPVSLVNSSKILVLNPLETFVGMSSFCPCPETLKNSFVDIGEDLFGDYVAVMIGLSLDLWIKNVNQIFRLARAHGDNSFSNVV